MVSLPTYDNNLFATRDQQRGLREAAEQPEQAAAQPRDPGALPAGLDVQARHRHRRPRRRQDHRQDQGPDARLPDSRLDQVLRLEPSRLRPVHIYCGFGHSSDTFFFQLAGMLGDRPARLLGEAVRLRRSRPASTCPARSPGSSRSNQWKQDTFGEQDLPGRDVPGRHRAGLRRRDAAPADQRLRGAGQRRQALPAADRARHRRAGRQRSSDRSSRRSSTSWPSRRACSGSMRNAARNVVLVRHTYNLVDMPIKVAGKSGTAEFGTRDSKGRLPFHSWFVGLRARRTRSTAPSTTRDSQLVVLAFAYDSRTKGNAAHRDREVLPPAPLRHQARLPSAEPAPARQLLPEQLMGVIRAEPARVTDWAAKSVGAAWRAFDLQLTTYAGLLVAIGLVMAYTNSVEAGSGPRGGTTFSRGLMWAGHRHRRRSSSRRPSTTAGSRPSPGRSTASSSALLVAHAGDRRRRRRVGALDLDRPARPSSSASSPRS